MVQGIDNIGICATDLERSVRFYRRLGFAEAYRNERGVMMAAGRVQLFLFQTRRSNPTPVSRELGLFGNPPGIDHISFFFSGRRGRIVWESHAGWRDLREQAGGSVLGRTYVRAQGPGW